MLAMHYAIPLADDGQLAGIRTRARERGPLFDNLAGLGVKLFLLDPVQPCYATFYLWRDPNAALAFLEGEFFQALTETFGRPEDKLLLTSATDLPFAAGESLSLLNNQPTTDASPLVEALDPRSGEHLGLASSDAAGRRFEVIYRAVGAPG